MGAGARVGCVGANTIAAGVGDVGGRKMRRRGGGGGESETVVAQMFRLNKTSKQARQVRPTASSGPPAAVAAGPNSISWPSALWIFSRLEGFFTTH